MVKDLGAALDQVDVTVGRRVEGAGIDGFYAHAECSKRILAARAGGPRIECSSRIRSAPPGATFFSVSHSQHSATLHAGLSSSTPSGSGKLLPDTFRGVPFSCLVVSRRIM